MFKTIATLFGTATAKAVGPARRPARLWVERMEGRDCPATLASQLQSVVSHTLADARQLVAHVAAVERSHPTVASGAIVRDLVVLDAAVKSGNVDTVFAGAGRVLDNLITEAAVIKARRLTQTSPLAYADVKADFRHLIGDKRDAVALVVRVQVAAQVAQARQLQEAFRIAPIAVSRQSIQRSQSQMAHLDALERQQSSMFNSDWVNSFNSSCG